MKPNQTRRRMIGLMFAGLACPAAADVPNPWAPRVLSGDEITALNTFIAALRLRVPEVMPATEVVRDHVRVRLSEDRLFRARTATLHENGVRLLTLLSDMILRHPVRMEAVGHHHADGQSYRAFIISQRRADAVVSAMRSRRIPADLLLATGLGENFPLASNATASGRAVNRRVELLFRNR